MLTSFSTALAVSGFLVGSCTSVYGGGEDWYDPGFCLSTPSKHWDLSDMGFADGVFAFLIGLLSIAVCPHFLPWSSVLAAQGNLENLQLATYCASLPVPHSACSEPVIPFVFLSLHIQFNLSLSSSNWMVIPTDPVSPCFPASWVDLGCCDTLCPLDLQQSFFFLPPANNKGWGRMGSCQNTLLPSPSPGVEA